ncbi:MAG TPA: hypothetical protein VH062_16335 [Polyangiaceae bacterium]|jgi:hypothetical protein|nr:hypothetical protein [Polyangiaceae bacterium]
MGALSCSSSGSDKDTTGDNSAGGSGSGGGGSTSGACTNGTLVLAFAPNMYSAYIPNSQHTFQLPVIVNGVSGATVNWTASDPSKVLIEPGDTSGGALLTMQGTGDVTITATAGNACGTSTLHIAAATEDQWAAGNARYNNMNALLTIQTDGGMPVIPPGGIMSLNIDPPDHPPACTNCHGDTAKSSFFRTISHTPEQTGGFTDAELISIFTQATVPTMGYFDQTIIPLFAWNFFHKWSDITGDAQEGMVVYLRSLTPKAQGGTVDFGGLMGLRPPGGGTGGSSATGAGGATTGAGGKTGSGGTTGAGGKTSTGGTTSTGGESSTGGAAGAAGAAGGGGTAGAGGGAAGASSGGAAGGGGASAGAGGT